MLEVVSYQDLTESSEESNEQGIKVFKLEVDDIPFGFLYLTDESYTLAWDGLLDFKRVDDEAQSFFYTQLDQLKHSDPQRSFLGLPVKKFTTLISLIISDKLVKYTLREKDQDQIDKFKNLLRQANEISFIRFDFLLRNPQFKCSFTAENPHSTRYRDCELAVMLPRSQAITRSFLRWVIKRHASSEELRKHEIDLKSSGAELSKLVGLYYNSANQFVVG